MGEKCMLSSITCSSSCDGLGAAATIPTHQHHTQSFYSLPLHVLSTLPRESTLCINSTHLPFIMSPVGKRLAGHLLASTPAAQGRQASSATSDCY